MKKIASILTWLLFILTILYPAGVQITACFGYSFELISMSVFAIVLAVLSVCIIVFDHIYKNTLENKPLQVFLAIIAPFSLINAVFYIFACPKIWVIAGVLISTGCCFYLTAQYGKPFALKIIALTLSALMVLPLGYVSFILLIFGNIGQNTVVETVGSPSGKYYAQVIDSDKGALGGDTLVDVYEKSGINAILFKIEKNPQRVYFGEWGEFNNMQIYWKDDACLMINSTEYKIQ